MRHQATPHSHIVLFRIHHAKKQAHALDDRCHVLVQLLNVLGRFAVAPTGIRSLYEVWLALSGPAAIMRDTTAKTLGGALCMRVGKVMVSFVAFVGWWGFVDRVAVVERGFEVVWRGGNQSPSP